ncbi:MAG TPA: hypothetical protein EYP98_14165, partial [Planctomycetes bacterium]|nr:hypothetical protein [Planctomycetota bacterium]
MLRPEDRAKPTATEHRLQPVLAIDDRAEQRVAGIEFTAPRRVVHHVQRQKRRIAMTQPDMIDEN